MLWYGIEAAVPEAPGRAIRLARTTSFRLLRRHIARRLAARLDVAPEAPDQLLLLAAEEKDAAFQEDVLEGMAAGLRGWRRAQPPEHWEAVRKSLTAPQLAERVRRLEEALEAGEDPS